jgi:hypothetical protein
MDALLILSGRDPAQTRRDIEQQARITHEASPRVVVVAGEDEAVRQLGRLPDIVSEEALAAGGIAPGRGDVREVVAGTAAARTV